jgi:hypothetical protein
VLRLFSSPNLRSAASFFSLFIQIDQAQDVATVLGGTTKPDGSRTTIQFASIFPQPWTASQRSCSSAFLLPEVCVDLYYSGAWCGGSWVSFLILVWVRGFCVCLDLHNFRFTKGDGVAIIFTWWGLKVAERPTCVWLRWWF